MSDDIAEILRERTAFRYRGDCKCGQCQLVPRMAVDRARTAILALRHEVDELSAAASFLLARLESHEGELLDDEAASDYFGHVVPAASRLRGMIDLLAA